MIWVRFGSFEAMEEVSKGARTAHFESSPSISIFMLIRHPSLPAIVLADSTWTVVYLFRNLFRQATSKCNASVDNLRLYFYPPAATRKRSMKHLDF